METGVPEPNNMNIITYYEPALVWTNETVWRWVTVSQFPKWVVVALRIKPTASYLQDLTDLDSASKTI